MALSRPDSLPTEAFWALDVPDKKELARTKTAKYAEHLSILAVMVSSSRANSILEARFVFRISTTIYRFQQPTMPLASKARSYRLLNP
jgi:hypothetical protein